MPPGDLPTQTQQIVGPTHSLSRGWLVGPAPLGHLRPQLDGKAMGWGMPIETSSRSLGPGAQAKDSGQPHWGPGCKSTSY